MSPSPLNDPSLNESSTDPFDTASLRAATLAAWRDSPTRLAEDVAVEADLRQIGYRDRWFTELAANAADAAVSDEAGGVSGGLVQVWADGPRLHVANVGTPLTLDGVRALTALRVSPKNSHDHRSGAVGRFGVGFRATSFADRVDILSTSGSITFDRARTREAAGVDDVPSQRLAWPLRDRPVDGFTTEVVLHCSSAQAAAELLNQARAEAPDLLLELPGLSFVIDGEAFTRHEGSGHVEIVDGAGTVLSRWLQSSSGGTRWLVPVDPPTEVLAPLASDVLRSPTPTQIPLTLPARLITDLPLTPDRRGLHPDADLAGAARGYADLITRAPADQRHLLVPEPSLGGGPEDAVLREAVLAELVSSSWVPSVSGSLLRPDRTWVLRGLSEPLAALLGELIEPLAAPSVSDGAAARTLLRLGARELTLAEVADLLTGVDRDPEWWAGLYAALDPLATRREDAEELGALPVPRTDGHLRRGVRGLALLDLPPGVEPRLDWIPVVAASAYHPLLDRLGLARLSVAEVLSDPALKQLLAEGDDDEHEELADAVLTLLGAEEPDSYSAVPSWIGTLRVRSGDGEPREVDELLLPGSPVREVYYDDEPLPVVDPAVVAAYGELALRRAGAAWGFTLVREELPTGPDHLLDAEEQWWDSLEVPPETLVAVRDLELVDPGRWPRALELLAEDPAIVAELADPAGYTGWWLRRNAVIDGPDGARRPVSVFRHPDDDTWRGLFDPLDHPSADALRGLLAGAGPDDAEQARQWLAALADPERSVAPGVAGRAHAALLSALRAHRLTLDDVDPPPAVRTVSGAVSESAVVLDEPWWAQVVPPDRAVVAGMHPNAAAAAEFAALIDFPLASEAMSARVVSQGRARDGADAPVAQLAAITGWDLAGPVVVHGSLVVALFTGDDEQRHRVSRWRDENGVLHIQEPPDSVPLQT